MNETTRPRVDKDGAWDDRFWTTEHLQVFLHREKPHDLIERDGFPVPFDLGGGHLLWAREEVFDWLVTRRRTKEERRAAREVVVREVVDEATKNEDELLEVIDRDVRKRHRREH
ncbi:hypothetical protein [Microlunatus flavus]|uniref:Uncharacterized protein n=1 Tax=Microlunatus flavus TaxID=1036181 RepID=A0A1H9IK70_9ACTN|nr:hypothetical protein [Microlunatus flavus]SEQ75000.1 hypothetical protein SAMN05421756_105285 [Microlunatus flavus]